MRCGLRVGREALVGGGVVSLRDVRLRRPFEEDALLKEQPGYGDRRYVAIARERFLEEGDGARRVAHFAEERGLGAEGQDRRSRASRPPAFDERGIEVALR